MNIKHVPKIIYANIAFMFYVIAASIGGIISRHNNSVWQRMLDVRLKYDLLFGAGFIILSIAVIIGILLKKEWGRVWAITFNSILLFSSVGIRVVAYVYVHVCCALAFNEVTIPIDIDAVVISTLSLLMLCCLLQNSTKEYFKTPTQ
jgi:hypothetical protein